MKNYEKEESKMIFINPWAFYHSNDIPDLNPQDDDEARGCICGACGYNSISNFCMAYAFYIEF